MKAKNAEAVAQGRVFKTLDEQVAESVAAERARPTLSQGSTFE